MPHRLADPSEQLVKPKDSLWAIVDLQPHELLESTRRFKIGLIHKFSIVLMLFGLPFVFIYVSIGLPWIAATIAGAQICCGLNLRYLQKSKSVEMTGHIAIFCLTVTVISSNLHSGGIHDPTMAWFYVIPVAAGVLTGWRGAAGWSLLIICYNVALLSLAHKGITFVDRVDPRVRDWQNLFERATAFAALLSIVIAFIYQRNKTHQELLAAQADALLASEAKSNFLANMSHEFRTPMNAIIGFSEIIEEDAQGEPFESISDDIKKILSASKHLSALLTNVLDLAKIEAGHMQLDLQPINIPRFVRDLQVVTEGRIVANGNKFLVHVDNQLVEITTDPTKLKQILFNLLANAAKFTRNGLVSLSVEPDGDSILFKVSDTGIGIPRKLRDAVFGKFVQVESDGQGGTGLGLSIAHRLAQTMQGNLSVESSMNVGSVFVLKLPRAVTGASQLTQISAPS